MEPLKLDFMGGVNLLHDERRIADNESRSLQNLIPVAPGLLGKRKGAKAEDSTQFPDGATISGVTTAAPTNMYVCIDPRMPRRIAFLRGIGTQFTDLDTAAAGIRADASNLFQWPAVPQRSPQATFLAGNIYMVAGLGDGYPTGAILSPDPSGGFTISTFSVAGTGNQFSPGVLAVYRQRMVYADFGVGQENYLVFSDDNNPAVVGNDVRALNGRSFKIGDDGERITALVDIMLAEAGDVNQSALLVLKEKSAYLLTGEPDQTTGGTDTIVVSKLSLEAGCGSHTAVARTPFGVFWAGADDVWMYHSGALPVRVGRKISPRLVDNSPADRHRWQMAYYNGFLRLAIRGPGQSGDQFLDVNNNGGATVDPSFTVVNIWPGRLEEQWWLDLREGSPQSWIDAKWYGPQVFKDAWQLNVAANTGIYCMAYDPVDDQLYGCSIGPVSILLESLGYYTFDTLNGYDEMWSSTSIPIPEDDQWENEISTQILGKDSDFAEPTRDKLLTKMEFDVAASVTTKLSPNYLVNGAVGGQFSFYAPGGTDIIVQAPGIHYGADTVDVARFTREFTQFAAFPLAGARQRLKRLQLFLQEQIGYCVDSIYTQFKFIQGVTARTATLTQGRYATLKDFLDMLVAAMNAAGGPGVFSHNVAGQSHGLVAVTNSTSIWAPDVTDASTRFQLVRGGFVVSAYIQALSQSAMSPARWRESGALELSSLALHVRLIPRRII